jgi:hypothetical protein
LVWRLELGTALVRLQAKSLGTWYESGGHWLALENGVSLSLTAPSFALRLNARVVLLRLRHEWTVRALLVERWLRHSERALAFCALRLHPRRCLIFEISLHVHMRINLLFLNKLSVLAALSLGRHSLSQVDWKPLLSLATETRIVH